MLIIRKEQMELFEKAARRQYRQRLAQWLREVLPTETAAYNDSALLDWIKLIEERAARWQVVTQYGVAQWASLSLVCGHRFDEHPSFRDYFSIPVLNPDDKLDALVEGINDACEVDDGCLSPSWRAER